MIRKISNIIYISVLAVVLFACGDDSTIEEQGSGTITARVMASNAYPALEEKVVMKVALNDGQDIQSVVWAKTGDTANMLLPMIAAMLAGTAVVGTISIRRRRR